MTKPTVIIHDLCTNEVIEREMTAEEVKQLNADKAQTETLKAEQAAKDAARQAVLGKLGLSADEAAALLG